MKYEAIITLGNNEVIGWWRRTDIINDSTRTHHTKSFNIWNCSYNSISIRFDCEWLCRGHCTDQHANARFQPTSNTDDYYYNILLSVFRSRLRHCLFMYSTLIGIGSVVAHMWTADLKVFTFAFATNTNSKCIRITSANHISFAISAKNHAFLQPTHISVVDSEKEKKIGRMANNNNNFLIFPFHCNFHRLQNSFIFSAFNLSGYFQKLTIIQWVSQSVETLTTTLNTTPFFIQRIQHSALPRRMAIIIIIITTDIRQYSSAPLVHILKMEHGMAYRWPRSKPEEINILASSSLSLSSSLIGLAAFWIVAKYSGWSSMCVVMWNGHYSGIQIIMRAPHFANEQWLT